MAKYTQNHDPQGNKPARRVDEARRHFLGLSAAVAARAAALGSLTAMVLPSSANADNAGKGRGWGWGREKDHGGKGLGHGRGPACFLRGTSILTASGPVRIEELERGNLVATVDGENLPVQWIGRRSYGKSGPSWPKVVMPIRVAEGALADGTPRSDLYLSPNHALLIDGVLIRVKDLVNGTSIAPALPKGRDVIEYFHIVLDTHKVILAEGAPAETCLLRERDHESFTNFPEYERLFAEGRGPVMKPYAGYAGYDGGRAHLKALLSLAAFSFIRLRDPVGEAHRTLAQRGAAELTS